MLALAAACMAGILMAVQGALNTGLSRFVGLLRAVFAVHASGLIMMIPLVLAIKSNSGSFSSAKWYYYLGGPLGVAIVYMVAAAISKAGAWRATTAIVTGQVLTAVILDHFGAFGLQKSPFPLVKLLGVAFLSLGAWILLRK